jgi:uncharacterized membrane protein HdeD (DUF308 family)
VLIMSATDEQFAELEVMDLTGLRRRWPWFVALGAGLGLVGAIALGSQVLASLVTVVVIGCLLVATGAVEIIGACQNNNWDGSFFRLMAGVLSVTGGVLFIREPGDDPMTLAMLLACVLLVAGILRITATATYQPPGWRSELLSAAIDFLLGIVIWLTFPLGGLWVIGLFVSISLIFRGFNWISLGMALRSAGSGSDAVDAQAIES